MEEMIMNSYLDIPRYYTAIAEWLCCMLLCFFYRRKVKTPVFAGVAALLAVELFVVRKGYQKRKNG